MQTAIVTIGEKQWPVSVAVTPEELAAGLAGLESIPAGAGMLFDLGSARAVQVTTEPMLFNIDVIFISEALQVTDIVLDAPPGYIITSETPVRYFLEVSAGETDEVETGDSVVIDYETQEDAPLIGELPGVTGFLQFAVTAAIMGLFVGGMFKMYTRTALGKPKPKEPPPRLEYPYYEYLSSTGKSGKPARSDIEIGAWAERDRLGIWLTDKRTDKTVAEWWDEDAQWMFEDGFFKPGDIRQQTITGRAFEESVLDYAESVGILAGRSEYLPQTELTPSRKAVIQPGYGYHIEYAGNITGEFRRPKTEVPVKVLELKYGGRSDDVLVEFEDGRLGIATIRSLKPLQSLPQTQRRPGKSSCYWTAINKDTGEIVESLAPYTSSGRALQGGKAFASRHWSGDTAHIEVWRQPYRYSENLKISAVASKTITLSKTLAVIPAETGASHRTRKDGLDFLADSPEFLAYTIDDIGYREKLDRAFQAAITRVNRGQEW
jgi:uncharacterized membrane protein (UPF0127 family)